MKIFIVGPAGSGKSEFARLLGRAMAQRAEIVYVAECGESLIRRAAFYHANLDWPEHVQGGDWVSFIRKNKERFRAYLRAIGDQLAIDAPGRLLSECADNASIVVGARRSVEAIAYYGTAAAGASAADMAGFQARRAKDKWIFIDRPGRELPADSFDRAWFDRFCDLHVLNRGDLAELKREAALLAADLLADKAEASA